MIRPPNRPPPLPQRTGLLSPGQQQKINDLIRLNHFALIVELMGDKAVPRAILTQIKTRGMYRKPRPDVLHRSFVYGSHAVMTPEVLSMTTRQFDQYLAEKHTMLDQGQREAISGIREAFTGYMKSLAEDMVNRVEKAVVKTDRNLTRRLAQQQRRGLFMELERRKAIASIAKDMTQITQAQLSDAKRTVVTETNNAYQDGRAHEIIKKSGGGDPLVFKQPRADACDDCIRAYISKDGVTPRLFRLSELAENGSNIGKSRGERQPVLDSFHPHCACELIWMPPGYGFDDEGQMVFTGQPLLGVKTA